MLHVKRKLKKLLLLLLLVIHEAYVNIKQEVIQWFKKCGIINTRKWNGDGILFDQNIGISVFFPTNKESNEDGILFDPNIGANHGITILIPSNRKSNDNDIFFNQILDSIMVYLFSLQVLMKSIEFSLDFEPN